LPSNSTRYIADSRAIGSTSISRSCPLPWSARMSCSVGALPVARPSPFSVQSTSVAPSSTAARLQATARPRLLCAWSPTSRSAASRMARTYCRTSAGCMPPAESTTYHHAAPALRVMAASRAISCGGRTYVCMQLIDTTSPCARARST
jgi:hypothetical protein